MPTVSVSAPHHPDSELPLLQLERGGAAVSLLRSELEGMAARHAVGGAAFAWDAWEPENGLLKFEGMLQRKWAALGMMSPNPPVALLHWT